MHGDILRGIGEPKSNEKPIYVFFHDSSNTWAYEAPKRLVFFFSWTIDLATIGSQIFAHTQHTRE